MWGGWEAAASDEQKTAYRLNKMDNRWGLMGQAAERAIMWVLKEHQDGALGRNHESQPLMIVSN